MLRVLPLAAAAIALLAAGWARGGAGTCSWRAVPTPSSFHGALVSVSARSPYDVWTIGSDYAGHWDGAHWTYTAVAAEQHSHAALADVWVAPNADAWAVGSAGRAALVESWDGTRWATVALGSAGRARLGAGSARRLRAVAGRDSRDLWAVGGDAFESHAAFRSRWAGVVLHWDGRSWRQAPVPAGLARGRTFFDVAVTRNGDVWVVGDSGYFSEDAGIALHFDGTRWRSYRLTGPAGTEGVVVHAITDVGGGDLVAAGWAGTGPGHYTGETWGLVFRFHSGRWTVRVPDYNGSFAAYEAVAARSTREVWIARNDASSFERQAGTQLFTALHPRARTQLPKGWVVHGLAFDGTDVWAVGGVGSGLARPGIDFEYARFRPFALRNRCGP